MIEHIIIIPVYQENFTILRETLDILASHSYATTNYRVCLAMEDRETGAQKKADILINKYQNLFLEITNSLHPTDLKGEMAGKSSNVNWATRFMYNRFPSNDQCSCQIITVIDSDTALAQDYFDCVTARYCIATTEDRVRMMFVTPMVFDRNAHKVPIFVKLTGRYCISFC
jgi:cellulose synthase/poly-beta-1,6-N-acetylglucosamine synthase-like glycosyltransferase